MPSRNIVKEYVPGGYYHIYNRGVEKRHIYMDEQDYFVFLDRLSDLLRQLSGEVELLGYCLMPNHFHLIIKQSESSGISKLMKGLGIRYTMYFNRRHSRIGGLFQARYKAALVSSDEQLMHLSRYVHLNPSKIRRSYQSYRYSSYKHYLSDNYPAWIDPTDITLHFKTKRDYSDFVAKTENSDSVLGKVAID